MKLLILQIIIWWVDLLEKIRSLLHVKKAKQKKKDQEEGKINISDNKINVCIKHKR